MLLLRTAAPCRDERDEVDERRDAPLPETLARDEAGFELGGIEPARVLGRVVQHEAAPQAPPLKLSEHGLDRASEVDVEIVHDKVNPARRAIALGDLPQRPHECGSLAVRCREGQARPGQRLDDAEDVLRSRTGRTRNRCEPACPAPSARLGKRYLAGGLEHALGDDPRPKPAPMLDSTQQARQRSLRWCTARRRRGAPAGRCGWWRWRRSSAASRRIWDERRRVWRWRTMASSRGGKKMWCVPEISGEFIDRMEDVLRLYARKLDPGEPVVCLDERPVVLREDTRRWPSPST